MFFRSPEHFGFLRYEVLSIFPKPYAELDSVDLSTLEEACRWAD